MIELPINHTYYWVSRRALADALANTDERFHIPALYGEQQCLDDIALAVATEPPPLPLFVPVRKVGGSYQWDGYIVSRFTTRTGKERVVFESETPPGVLHIYDPGQLRIRG